VLLCTLAGVAAAGSAKSAVQPEPPIPLNRSTDFRQDWQEYLNQLLQQSSAKPMEAYALLSMAGWADQGQLILLVKSDGQMAEGYLAHPGVSLARFRDEAAEALKSSKSSHETPKSFTRVEGDFKVIADDFDRLLRSEDILRPGLDHMKYLAIHISKRNGVLRHRSVLLDSPMLEVDGKAQLASIEAIMKWARSQSQEQQRQGQP
jgi:hypothetical protein